MAATTTGAAVLNSNLADGLGQRKIPSLDGLRAVAVILVILNHLKVPFAPEGRGVLTFFVLSGFLITWMMLNESEKHDSISIRNFYVRRVLRIFPAFYVFLVVAFVSRLLTQGWPSGSQLGDYLSAFTYTSNYRFALTPHVDHTCWHTWALSVEEQFYLLWPCVLVAFRKDLRKLTHVLIAIIVLVDIYRMVMFFKFHVDDHWLSYAFESRVDHLLVGCLLAVLLKRGTLMNFWNFLTSRVWISLVPFGLIVLSIALAFRFHFAYKYAVGFVLDPLLTAVFILQVIAMGSTALWGWLNWKVVRYVGQVSYGMFLYHMMVNRLVIDLFGHHSLWFQVPVVIAGSTLMGACSFHVVEQKFLRLKSKFTGKAEKKPVATAAPEYQLVS